MDVELLSLLPRLSSTRVAEDVPNEDLDELYMASWLGIPSVDECALEEEAVW